MFEVTNVARARQQELIDDATTIVPHTTHRGRAQRRWWRR